MRKRRWRITTGRWPSSRATSRNLANRPGAGRHRPRPAEALADYDRIVALAPKDAEMLEPARRHAAGAGTIGRGAGQLDQALRLEPDFATALNNRGFLLWTVEAPL